MSRIGPWKQRRRRLRLDSLPPLQRQRVNLLHGSLVYTDSRLAGHDVARSHGGDSNTSMFSRLDAFEEAVFGTARNPRPFS